MRNKTAQNKNVVITVMVENNKNKSEARKKKR